MFLLDVTAMINGPSRTRLMPEAERHGKMEMFRTPVYAFGRLR
jgi:hypothetical protein